MTVTRLLSHLLVLSAAVIATAQPAQNAAQDVARDQAQADHIKDMAPGAEHAQLAKCAGDWVVSTALQMPGQAEVKTVGHVTIKLALGGRFIQETGTGEMMGMPVEHFKMLGYNNGSKKYEGMWTWTMATSMLRLEGTSSNGGKSIELTAVAESAPGSKGEFKVRYTFIDDNSFTVEVFGGKMPDGTPGPTMTSSYLRKQW